MPYKIPKIPIFDSLVGIEKRVQGLQQNIAELDWLEYSFGLSKRVELGAGDDLHEAPVIYTGVHSDPLSMMMWPNDVYKAYAFWELLEADEFQYFDNVSAMRRFPKVVQPLALIVCLDNDKISPGQDRNVTHSICRMELINKLNSKNTTSGIFTIASVLQNTDGVFDGYDMRPLTEPYSCLRIEGTLTYTQDC